MSRDLGMLSMLLLVWKAVANALSRVLSQPPARERWKIRNGEALAAVRFVHGSTMVIQ